ncbi:MAG TPA: nitroreductase [bacterium]|nr:nitroreductase [bacterium]
MIPLTHPVHRLIRGRTSVRTYEKRLLSAANVDQIDRVVSGIGSGPFGSRLRIRFIGSVESDSGVLKGLGTYGVIRNPAGFVIGAVDPGPAGNGLIDFGYAMESAVLYLADLGLGTCWLGGTFRKSRFAGRIDPAKDEIVPSVISVGYPRSRRRPLEHIMRLAAGSAMRKPWETLFFLDDLAHPLEPEDAGEYADALESVRLAPSASNRQPWRVCFDAGNRRFHFYLRRAKAYRPEKLGMADLQRVDMGIAMCHFELAVRHAGMEGDWVHADPSRDPHPLFLDYIMSWQITARSLP